MKKQITEVTVGKSVIYRALLATCVAVTVAVTAWTAAAGAASLDGTSSRSARAHCLRRSVERRELQGLTAPSPPTITRLTGGGVAYSFDLGNGVTATFPVPPSGFKPLEATDVQLAEYGFQPRPTSDSPAYDSWAATMATYRSTPVPSILFSSPPVAGPFESSDGLVPPPAAGYVTGSWGGWLANSSSQTYVATEMDLTEPSVTSYCSGYNSEAQWTGLGGFNSKQLVQDGVEVPSSYTSLCSSKSSGYCAWYEYLNSSNSNPPHILSKVDVNAGDSIHLYTSYSTSNGEIDFYVADNTTGTGQSLLITGVDSSYYDGSTGDFIGAERLAGSGLKHFSQFDTSNGYAENKSGSWTTISSAQYPTKATLTNGSDTLAITGGLNSSGTGFSMTWNACN